MHEIGSKVHKHILLPE